MRTEFGNIAGMEEERKPSRVEEDGKAADMEADLNNISRCLLTSIIKIIRYSNFRQIIC